MRLRCLFLSLLLAVVVSAQSQWPMADSQPPISEWSVGAGELRTYDPTLSPQQYTGWSLHFRGYHYNYYQPKAKGQMPTAEWSFRDRFRYGNLLNASRSARIYYYSADLTFGTHYVFRPIEGMRIRLGGALQLYGDLKDQSRNVNNVASGVVQFQALATFHLSYHKDFTSRFAMTFSYGCETPLVGCRFAPGYGESYYEIYLKLPDLTDNVAFTSLHNHQALMGDLRVDFLFDGKGSLFLTFNHEHDYFRHANSLFYQNDLSGAIGFALRLQAISIDN